MSNNYDVLFAVILRILDERGSKIYKNIDEITQKLGESIKTSEYENYAVYPLGMELVEPDKKIRILNRLKYDEDAFEDEELIEDEESEA
ncbi:MAG: hypothetical protein J6M08_02080 [Methanobrevibacter sp.]|nr:hypothetical protein [Methanobrevibacter sp.]